MMRKVDKEKLKNIMIIIKYFFSVYITLLAYKTVGDCKYLVVSLLELVVFIYISVYCYMRNRVLGHILHFILILIYNIQTVVMYFGGSFVSLIMVTNLTFVNGLQGKFGAYIKLIVPLIVCTMIPIREISVEKRKLCLGMFSLIALEMMALIGLGTTYSPSYNLFYLYSDWKDYLDMNSQVEVANSSAVDFYNEGIDQYIDKPQVLTDKPNVVLIFIEGISESILHDERNIMHNLQKFESESVHFENYYNHTFATLRGLIGQLYSGYQLNNMDTNALFSMQSIFEKNGYQTTFINTEPTNEEFTTYLTSFGFNNLLTDATLVESNEIYIHDKEAFDLLYQTITVQGEEGIPFFTVMYTLGTHTTFDSPDEQYDDGSDAMLNKYYNTDIQFGEFFKKFKESKLIDNTILIVTTDHATYVDDSYVKTFARQTRQHSELDKIPLCIYHKGVIPKTIDVNGRNSLDFAPTILDYLDISSPNCFLGQSLFSKQENLNSYDTIFHDAGNVLTTYGNQINELTQEKYAEFIEKIIQYSVAKGDASLGEINSEYVSTNISDDNATLTITLESKNEYENIWFPVWSEEHGQDDLEWYQATKNEEENWESIVNLSKHNSKGVYKILVYSGTQEPEEKISATTVTLLDYPPFHVDSEISEDMRTVTVTLTQAEGYDNIQFPIWSKDQEQDDIIWYHPEKNEEEAWSCTINVEDHCTFVPDKIIIHVYGENLETGESEFLAASSVSIE